MKGSISISRPTYGNGDKFIVITVTDDSSQARFIDVKIGYEQFTEALTGISGVEIDFDVRALSYVGMKMVREKRRILCQAPSYDRARQREWLEENAQEEGWFLDSYLGSQSSVSHTNEGTYLNYAVYRYEPVSHG